MLLTTAAALAPLPNEVITESITQDMVDEMVDVCLIDIVLPGSINPNKRQLIISNVPRDRIMRERCIV